MIFYPLLVRCSKPEQIGPYATLGFNAQAFIFDYGVRNFIYRKLLCNSEFRPCVMLGMISMKSRIPNPVSDPSMLSGDLR